MLNIENIKNALSNIDIDNITEQNKISIREIASQIGFTTPDAGCKCKDGYRDLFIKLRLWVKAHPNGLHYTMKPGIVRKGSKGQNVYNLTLTDSEAEWLLENDPEGAVFITKILEEEEKEDTKVLEEKEEDTKIPEEKEDTRVLFSNNTFEIVEKSLTEEAEDVTATPEPTPKKKARKKKS